MLSTLKRILLKWMDAQKTAQIKSLVTLSGTGQEFDRSTYVRLADGSTPADIIIGENAMISGTLASEHHGKITMGKWTYLRENSYIGCVNEVTIGDYTSIADYVVVMDNNNHPVHPEDRRIKSGSRKGSDFRKWRHSDSAPIIIEENVWIGSFSRICKGVRIGANSIVAANSVVTKDVPPNCIVAGNPARVVKTDIDQVPRIFK